MNPTANNTPESWRQSDAALRRALQQRNEGLPSLPAGFNERMKERMAAEKATAAGTSAPQKRRLWPWWSAAAAVAAIAAMLLWPRTNEVENALAEISFQQDVAHTQHRRGETEAASHFNGGSPATTEDRVPLGTRQQNLSAVTTAHVPLTDSVLTVETTAANEGTTASNEGTTDDNEVTIVPSDKQPAAVTSGKQSHPVSIPSQPRPTAQPATHSPRLLALSLHTSNLGFGSNGGGNQVLANYRNEDYLWAHDEIGVDSRDKNAYHTNNYYFLAANGFTYSNYVSVNSTSQNFANNAVTIDESHHDLPFTLGLSVNVPLSERWSLESGVTFTSLRSTFDYGNEQSYSHKRQRINYLGVPLLAQYSFISSRAVRLYALAGLQVDFPLSIKQEWQQFTNGRLTKEETTSPFSLVPVQFSPIAGLGAQLNVTRHLSVFCQPSVQWYVPASDPVGGSGLQTWRTEHELAFSIPFGLRWTF
ncbi:MAG: PorT family protein [Bacteroidaceae bacterium]|nr:PorT family protein [Bacteroidaceae bacterium]